jgi:hypothetical protein
LLQKREDAQRKVDETSRHWGQTFQEFEDMVECKIRKLTEEQKQELDEFDATVPKDLPPDYEKYSVQYVVLRKQETFLARNEEYVVANAVKRRADALQKAELAAQTRKLHDDLRRKRNAIIDKHTRQYGAFALWLNERRHGMIKERDKDLEGALRRLDHYTRLSETIEEQGLPPNRYGRYTSNRVSRKENVRAMRLLVQKPRARHEPKPRERPPIPGFRPTSAMTSKTRSFGGEQSKSRGSNR